MRLVRWIQRRLRLRRRIRPLAELPAATSPEVHEAEENQLEELQRRLDRVERQRDVVQRRRRPDTS
jgi:hypothetical protein